MFVSKNHILSLHVINTNDKRKIKHTKANFGWENIQKMKGSKMTSKLVWETLIKNNERFPLYTNYKSDIKKNKISAAKKSNKVTLNIGIRAPKSKVVSVLHFPTKLEIIHQKNQNSPAKRTNNYNLQRWVSGLRALNNNLWMFFVYLLTWNHRS